MTVVEYVACTDVNRLTALVWLPSPVCYVENGAHRTLAYHGLRAVPYVLKHYGFLAVPAVERAAAVCRAGVKHVLAISLVTLLLRSVEGGLRNIHLIVAVTIVVKRLTVVGIHAEAYHVILHDGSVREYVVIGVGVLRESHRRDTLVLLVLLRAVAYAEVAVCAVFIFAWLALLRQRDGECLFLLLCHIGDKGQLVKLAVIVKVVKLARYLLAVKGYKC